METRLREIGLGLLTSFLAGFGGCLAGGCSTVKEFSIGTAMDPPAFELNLPGMDLKVRPIELTVTFEDEPEATETDTD